MPSRVESSRPSKGGWRGSSGERLHVTANARAVKTEGMQPKQPPSRQHRQVLVHSLEQPVESQHEEDQDGPAEQVGDDAEAEEQLVSGDVVGRRRRVPMHEQLAGNIDEAQWSGDYEEQVQESGDSPWVVGRAHVPSP